MEELFLTVLSSVPALVKIDGVERYLDNCYESAVFRIVNQSSILIKYYPTLQSNMRAIPYIAKLDFNNLKEEGNYTLTVFDKKNVMLNLKPLLVFDEGQKYSKKIKVLGKQYFCQVFCGEISKIYISSNTKRIEKSFTGNPSNVSLSTNGDILIANVNLQNEKSFIVVLKTTNFDVLFDGECDDFILEKNCITLKVCVDDMARHGKLLKFFNEDGKTKTSEIIVYNNNNKPEVIKDCALLPYAFFEAIKIKNFKLGRYYLCQQLNDKLSNQHFEEFFGNFVDVVPPPKTIGQTQNSVALIFKSGNTHKASIFNVAIKDNKITNIFRQN